MTQSFLDGDYKEPTNSDYLKLSEWTTKVRVLQNPLLIGTKWTDWEDKREVVRELLQTPQDLTQGYSIAWLCLVWNYDEHKVQIWEISQKTIRTELSALWKDTDFWPWTKYDLKITRTGKGQNDTKYSIQALPKSELWDDVDPQDIAVNVNLEEYITTGENPFKQD